MKINTLLKKLLLLAALLFISILSFAQKPAKIEKEFKRMAKVMAEKYEWLSFDVCRQNFRNDTLNWDIKYSVILHYDKENPVLLVLHRDFQDVLHNGQSWTPVPTRFVCRLNTTKQ